MGEVFSLDISGEEVPVKVRRSRQAKRLVLRVDKMSGEVKLTMPAFASTKSAERFLSANTSWLQSELNALEPHQVVGDGDAIPFLGDTLEVEFSGVPPRSVTVADDKLMVGGPKDLASARLEKWLRAEAKKVLTERASFHAEKLGVNFNRISIGDMKSRWGSCSTSGTIRFSWRLILAPFEVLDYVAAHEVAHILEMNHSEAFWAHVARCIPDHKVRRKWLKTEGNALFKIRFDGAV